MTAKACPGAGEGEGTLTSTVLSHQPSAGSSRANNGALQHKARGEKEQRYGSCTWHQWARWMERHRVGKHQHMPQPPRQAAHHSLQKTGTSSSAKTGLGQGAHTEEWEPLCDDCQPSHLHRGPKRPAIRGMHVWERAVLASKAQRQWPNSEVSSDWLPGRPYQLVHSYPANSNSGNTC